ncbi:MAG TPA: hypothetical protein PLF13_09445 [candidate division Zixibacteria bacterium]|nr:hypothetical protein [candidate division Zixibacteria bacterium]
MGDYKMTGELRTDLDHEFTDIPADKWAETVLTINGEEIVVEVSLEDKPIVAIMAGEEAVWKGTLEGLKMLLRGEINAR